MFENRSEKQLIIIYILIALIITIILSLYHLSPISAWPKDPILIIIAANIEFFCIFYILYLPLKVKRGQK
ncbi:MAG: hypothetical protein AYK22_01410 [Thermoplasmatales archaeon SG8-52-3]|nr:MAG: hypothetical protein AYK22_01410 [Thermoplasmatales archaeon SG8-52-3]